MYSFKISVFVVIIKAVLLEAAQTERSAPDPGFKKYEIVQPVLQHRRNKRETPYARDESGSYPREVTIKIKHYTLDLRMNVDLLADNYVISYQKNGRIVHKKPKNEEKRFCYYGGTVRGKRNSWVAVSTCHGIEGAIYNGHELTHIQPVQGSSTYEHFLYNHNDWSQPFICGDKSAGNNSIQASQTNQRFVFSEKQEAKSSKAHWYKKQPSHFMEMNGTLSKNTDMENEGWKYVELLLVADNSIFVANNRDLYTVSHSMKTLTNIVNAFYAPLNISLVLVGVVVWNENDEVFINKNSSITLGDFQVYRRTKLVNDIPNDNAFLITGKRFIKGVIGLASLETMCSTWASCGLASNTSIAGPLALIVAHELGHNFGMEHDNVNIPDYVCKCPGLKKCIMYPSASDTGFNPVHWSLCSLNYLKAGLSKGLDYCLRNKPKRLLNFSVCGNGFVEAGEQCDCGTVTDPRAPSPCLQCCDPKTCTLRANATCGAGQCCDLQTCRLKSAGTVCRSADRECDLPEYCTGRSENCPDDVHKMDTTPCGKGETKAYCVGGKCHSHTDQCRLIWGAESRSSDAQEYDINAGGTWYGDCGFDFSKLNFSKVCKSQDVMCGRLYCECETSFPCELHIKNALVKPEHITVLNLATLKYDPVFNIIDMGSSAVDLGLVPDGAICGKDKMCFNQECVSINELRKRLGQNGTLPCPADCSGHGICKSGHCYCERGYIPPLCVPPDSIESKDEELTTKKPRKTTKRPIDYTENYPTVTTTDVTEVVTTTTVKVTTSKPSISESTTESNDTSEEVDSINLIDLQWMITIYVFSIGFGIALMGTLVWGVIYFRKCERLRNLLRFKNQH